MILTRGPYPVGGISVCLVSNESNKKLNQIKRFFFVVVTLIVLWKVQHLNKKRDQISKLPNELTFISIFTKVTQKSSW